MSDKSDKSGKPDKINMTWEDVEVAVANLCMVFQERNYKPKHIVGIAKGGVIPATLIHQRYPEATFSTLQVRSYGHVLIPREPEIVGDYQPFYDDASTLVVDDIKDTGGTHIFLSDQFPNCTFAYMSVRDYQAPGTIYKGWIWGRGWINFPWEKALEQIAPVF